MTHSKTAHHTKAMAAHKAAGEAMARGDHGAAMSHVGHMLQALKMAHRMAAMGGAVPAATRATTAAEESGEPMATEAKDTKNALRARLAKFRK